MLNLIPLNLTIIGQYEGINVDQEVDPTIVLYLTIIFIVFNHLSAPLLPMKWTLL